MREFRRNAMISWFISMAGVWLILSPIILNYTRTTAATNDIVVGLFIVLMGVISAVFGRTIAAYISTLVIIAGVWEIAAPFVLGYTSLGIASTNSVILGIVLVFLAISKVFNLGTTPRSETTYYYGRRPEIDHPDMPERRYTSEIRRRRETRMTDQMDDERDELD